MGFFDENPAGAVGKFPGGIRTVLLAIQPETVPLPTKAPRLGKEFWLMVVILVLAVVAAILYVHPGVKDICSRSTLAKFHTLLASTTFGMLVVWPTSFLTWFRLKHVTSLAADTGVVKSAYKTLMLELHKNDPSLVKMTRTEFATTVETSEEAPLQPSPKIKMHIPKTKSDWITAHGELALIIVFALISVGILASYLWALPCANPEDCADSASDTPASQHNCTASQISISKRRQTIFLQIGTGMLVGLPFAFIEWIRGGKQRTLRRTATKLSFYQHELKKLPEQLGQVTVLLRAVEDMKGRLLDLQL
jgi:hypothetical protein